MAGKLMSRSEERLQTWHANGGGGAGKFTASSSSSSCSPSSASSSSSVEKTTLKKNALRVEVSEEAFSSVSANCSRGDNPNNNNNNEDETAGRKCSRCEPREESTTEALPNLGRKQPINVVTIFAKGDDKRHLLDCPQLITIHDLNPRENLIEQWNRLSLPPQGPDLIVAKLHKALGSKDIKPSATAIMKNYESLRQSHWNVFQRLEVVPLETEVLLTNRFTMQDLIEKVCNAVNFTLNNQESTTKRKTETVRHPRRLAEKKLHEILSASKSISSSRGANGGDGSGENRSICSKPKSIRLHFPTSTSTTTAAASRTSPAVNPVAQPTSAPVSNCYSPFSSSSSFASSSSPSNVDGSWPPFPLIVKSSSTSTKAMAMVLDEAALRDFAGGVVGGGVVIEQFVQHDNAILKMYIIGKEVFVVRRRSLPNVTLFSESAVRQFAEEVGGEFVPLEESPVGGYAVYQSDKMPKTNNGVAALEECGDLDVAVFRLLTQALARELRVDLFGFDVLVESKTRNIFVVDVNVLPGFKGVPSSQRRLCEWLSFLATRRAFKEDCLSLSPQDLLRLSLSRDDEEPRVNLETLRVRPITRNRIFEVLFKEKLDSPGARTRHTLVKFRPVQTPRRLVEDRDHFVSNLATYLASKGLGPPFIKDVSAVYFDRRRHLGMVREWIEGAPLHSRLASLPAGAVGLDAIFRGVGVSLARFHLLSDDAEFRSGVLERHFPGALSTPIIFRLMELWRRDAVLSLLCAGAAMESSSVWRDLYSGVIAVSRDLESIVGVIVERILTPEAVKCVFGHFDANTNNIIVCHAAADDVQRIEVRDEVKKGEEKGHALRNGEVVGEGAGVTKEEVADIFLIDEEWAAPNVAIYDFAKFVTSVAIMMRRKSTPLTEAELRRGLELMAERYLRTMAEATRKEEEEAEEEEEVGEEKVKDFVSDVWTFVPLAALTNCFSNLIHATKEGQLLSGEIPASGELFQPDGTFNWLRHAQDHLQVFRSYFGALGSGS